jgi:peroxiredoxin
VDREVGGLYGTRRPDDHERAAAPRRFTYLIDPGGRVAKAYVVRDIAAHPDEVLADLRSLRGS